ncbi:MAG: hypothetical protein JST22_18540 [Bacteroidetes bacterium]|nr:hypothetical protein [Bacteroidota bacterium]
MSYRSILPRRIVWTIIVAAAVVVAGAETARAQCTGVFHVADFPEGGPCFALSFPPCYEVAGTNYLKFTGNGTYTNPLCCAPGPDHHVSLTIAGTLVESGETKTITSECGCASATVGLTDASGVVNINLTYLGPASCP